MMKIAFKRLRKDRRSFLLRRLNLMHKIMHMLLILPIRQPPELLQQRKLMMILNGIESSTHSKVSSMKMMAPDGTWVMVESSVESTTI